MFPATVLVALLVGFHTSTVLMASGVATIVALLGSRFGIGKFIPLYYGSSLQLYRRHSGRDQRLLWDTSLR